MFQENSFSSVGALSNHKQNLQNQQERVSLESPVVLFNEQVDFIQPPALQIDSPLNSSSSQSQYQDNNLNINQQCPQKNPQQLDIGPHNTQGINLPLDFVDIINQDQQHDYMVESSNNPNILQNSSSQLPQPKRSILGQRKVKQLVNNVTQKKKTFGIVQQLKLAQAIKKYYSQFPSRLLKKLKQRNFNFIFDKASNLNFEEHSEALSIAAKTTNNNRLSSTSNLIRCCLIKLYQRIPLIDPLSWTCLLLDIIMVILVLLYFFFLPIHSTFHLKLGELFGNSLALIMTVSFIIIDFLQLFTCYYSKGELIQDQRRIAIRYLKNNLLNDILPLAIVVIIIADNYHYMGDFLEQFHEYYNIALNILFVTKYPNFKKRIQKIKERISIKRNYYQKLMLINLLCTLLIIAHYQSCIWCFIAFQEKDFDQTKRTWLDAIRVNDEPWYIQYLNGYYYSTVTMVTVGYGDITPQTPLEKVVSIMTMLLSCGVFGYIMNSIGVIVQELEKAKQKQMDQLITINNYMDKKKISRGLQFQIRDYIQFQQEIFLESKEQEQKIINSLSEPLKKALLHESNKIILFSNDSPIFHSQFSEKLKDSLISIVQEKKFQPNDVIMSNQIGNGTGQEDFALYFIEKGTIQININKNDNQMDQIQLPQNNITTPIQSKMKNAHSRICKKGQSFCTFEFFTGIHSNVSIKSLDESSLLVIKRDDFLSLLQDYQEDYQKFCQIKDDFLLYNNYHQVKLKCLSCGELNHTYLECPLTHYIPLKYRLIKYYNQQQSKLQSRKKLEEKRYLSKFNSLFNQDIVIEERNDFLEEYQSYINNSHWINIIEYEDQSDDELSQANRRCTIFKKDSSRQSISRQSITRQSLQVKQFINKQQSIQLEQKDGPSESSSGPSQQYDQCSENKQSKNSLPSIQEINQENSFLVNPAKQKKHNKQIKKLQNTNDQNVLQKQLSKQIRENNIGNGKQNIDLISTILQIQEQMISQKSLDQDPNLDFYTQFDIMKQYLFYYPDGNFSRVIDRIKKKQEKKNSICKKRSTFHTSCKQLQIKITVKNNSGKDFNQ